MKMFKESKHKLKVNKLIAFNGKSYVMNGVSRQKPIMLHNET